MGNQENRIPVNDTKPIELAKVLETVEPLPEVTSIYKGTLRSKGQFSLNTSDGNNVSKTAATESFKVDIVKDDEAESDD